MRKHFVLFAFITSFALQTGMIAQPYDNRPAPQVEVQIQRLPSSQEGNYYDSSGASPQIQVNYRQDPRNRAYQQQPMRGNSSYDREESYSKDSYQRNGSYNGVNQSPSGVIDDMPQQTIERTLSILKPDAIRNRHIGDIISRFEDNGLRIVGIKMVRLNPEQASQFYNIHRERPFFKDLIQFMSSGPVVVMVLEGDQAISKNRQLMGATDPKQAEKGTIRADYAESVSHNTVHGSDSAQSARAEIPFFFQPNELYSGY